MADDKKVVSVPPTKKLGAPNTQRFLVTTSLLAEEVQSLLGRDGTVEPYTEQTPGPGKPGGPTHDAYGNPYNRGAAHSSTHDAYGNPYNKE